MFDHQMSSDGLLFTLYVDRLVGSVVTALLTQRSVADPEKGVGVQPKVVVEMLTGVVEFDLPLAVGFEGS